MNRLGFDDWFAERAGTLLQPGQCVARVMTLDRGAFLVQSERGEATAEISGKLRFAAESAPDLPCVGDWVCVEHPSPTLAIIHAILPRKTVLRRKRPGKTIDYQMLAANLDLAFIVQSCHYDFNIRRLDRYLVMTHDGGIEPVIVLSKTDLVGTEELTGMMEQISATGISAPLLPVSNTTGAGMDALREWLRPGQTCCLLGSSGVGKTTLINRLLGEDVLSTKVVSESGEGVHTTTRRQLIALDNGALLLDTPGMRELGLLGSGDGLENSFGDIQALSRDCRFSDCTHMQEPGCAVLNAIEEGQLSRGHYESYLKLVRENEFHDLSYVEKRRRGKDLSRHIKSVMKHRRK